MSPTSTVPVAFCEITAVLKIGRHNTCIGTRDHYQGRAFTLSEARAPEYCVPGVALCDDHADRFAALAPREFCCRAKEPGDNSRIFGRYQVYDPGVFCVAANDCIPGEVAANSGLHNHVCGTGISKITPIKIARIPFGRDASCRSKNSFESRKFLIARSGMQLDVTIAFFAFPTSARQHGVSCSCQHLGDSLRSN